MIYIYSLFTILVGTVLLSLAMQKHYKVFLSAASSNSIQLRRLFRLLGYGFLLVGLYLATLEEDFGIALTTFLGMFTLTHIAVVLYLSKKST